MSHWGKPVRVINRDTRLDNVETAILALEELGKALPDEYEELRAEIETDTAKLLVKFLMPARERSERDE